ncbi:hypothetical protein KEM56_000517 [Ascosphaera pollenicola]|nr:hypothetical protein KEM56_000517 [Ascosphaera pollenicola]
MYTTYFAILALLFFILENPDSTTARDGILKDAVEGKNTLAGLAKNSMAADRCAQSLNSIFKHLPEKLRNRQPASQMNKKRPSIEPTAAPATTTSTTKAELPSSASESSLSGKWSQGAQRTSNASASKLNSGKKHNRRSSRMTNNNGPGPTLAHHGPSHLSNSMTISQLPPTNGDTNMTDLVQSTESSAASTPQLPQQELSQMGFEQNQSQAQTQPAPPQASAQQQQQAQSQQFTFGGALDKMNFIPDLMPMMFPSDDPFAYPTQPMSTLEDSTFKDFGNMNDQQQTGLENNQFMGSSSSFLQNVFDSKQTNSMPNLTTLVTGDASATASNPDLTPYSADSDIALHPALPPPMRPIVDDFAPATFGMPNFTYFNNVQPQYPENDMSMQDMPSTSTAATTSDSVLGNGIMPSPSEMPYNMNTPNPFVWARGEDGNAVNTSSHNRVSLSGHNNNNNSVDIDGRLGSTTTPMRLKPNGRTSSDATQPDSVFSA